VPCSPGGLLARGEDTMLYLSYTEAD